MWTTSASESEEKKILEHIIIADWRNWERESEKRPEIREKDFRERITKCWGFFCVSLFCIFPSFKSNKNFTENTKIRAMDFFFSFISIASVVVHGWVCGMCEDEMTKQRVKLQKHAYRTSSAAAAVAWCSTWCFFNVQRMMNDPLNSCKRPIKYIFDSLLTVKTAMWIGRLFICFFSLVRYVRLLFHFVVVIFIALSPITLSLLIGRIVIHFL